MTQSRLLDGFVSASFSDDDTFNRTTTSDANASEPNARAASAQIAPLKVQSKHSSPVVRGRPAGHEDRGNSIFQKQNLWASGFEI